MIRFTMDLQFFINILLKRKWLILISVFVAGAAAFFFVDRQPPVYKSNAVITTGIMGTQGLNLERENPFWQPFMVDMSFGNLIEFIQSRSNIDLLSYELLIHDLADSRERPFRQMKQDEEKPLNYTKAEVENLIRKMRGNLDSLVSGFSNPETDIIFKDLAKAYEYDFESITENLIVNRKNTDSDLLNIEFESENPELCKFAVNTFCQNFLKTHRKLQAKKDEGMVGFYTEMVNTKRKALDDLQLEIENFKRQGGLVDLESQKEATVSQIKELEVRKEEEEARIPSLKKSITELNQYLAEHSKDGSSNAVLMQTGKNISNLQNRIKDLNDQYINSDYKDEKIRLQLDATRKLLNDRLKQLAEASPDDNSPQGDAKATNILATKINTEMELNEANSAVSSIEAELRLLRSKATSLVSSDSYIQNLETERDILTDEYTYLVGELNKATINLKNVISNPLRILEHAQIPEEPEPSKKVIIAGFAGVVAGIMCTILILLLAYFDTSLSNPVQFEKFTNLPLMGSLNQIQTKDLDLLQLFNSNGQAKGLDFYRESLRNLRFAIEQANASTFLFTSLKEEEGKTFMMLNLAQSLQIKNKKVLLLDTNFKHNTLSDIADPVPQPNTEIQKLIVDYRLADVFGQKQINSIFNIKGVDVIANSGNYLSPAEIFAGKDFLTFLDKLTLHYDYIFFEAPAMNKYSDTKELVEYAEKVVAVFSAESELKQADKNALSYLRSLDQKFMGSVLNKIDLKNLA